MRVRDMRTSGAICIFYSRCVYIWALINPVTCLVRSRFATIFCRPCLSFQFFKMSVLSGRRSFHCLDWPSQSSDIITDVLPYQTNHTNHFHTTTFTPTVITTVAATTPNTSSTAAILETTTVCTSSLLNWWKLRRPSRWWQKCWRCRQRQMNQLSALISTYDVQWLVSCLLLCFSKKLWKSICIISWLVVSSFCMQTQTGGRCFLQSLIGDLLVLVLPSSLTSSLSLNSFQPSPIFLAQTLISSSFSYFFHSITLFPPTCGIRTRHSLNFNYKKRKWGFFLSPKFDN